MPLSLALQNVDVPQIISALGGWPPVLIGLTVVLAFLGALAWAPVAAINAILAHFAKQDAARQESELARAKVEADARVTSSANHRDGLVKVAASSEHVAEAMQGLATGLAGTEAQLSEIQATGRETAAKVSRANEVLVKIEDRTRRNGAPA